MTTIIKREIKKFLTTPRFYIFAAISWFFGNILFLVPVLTMRFAKENIEIDASLSVRKIVLTKYFAALIMLAAMLLLTVNPLYYAGLILFGAAFVAIGIFISSMSKNWFAAQWKTIAVIILLLFIDTIGVWSGNLRLARITAFISPSRRLHELQSGTSYFAPIVYFIVVAVWFILATIYITGKRPAYETRKESENEHI